MFKGSLVALITPMREDGTVDEKAYAEFVEWQIKEGTHGVIPVGFSLGGNLVLKYLAEGGATVPVMAAISISAPIDLQAAQQCIAQPRNALYHRHMLDWVKSEHHGEIGPEIRSMLDFDNAIVAPANGFKDALDYYRQSSAAPMLGAIRRPTLLIHADDDPWIPVASYRAITPSLNPNLIPLLPSSGGHVGFHARGLAAPWHEVAMIRFLDALRAFSESHRIDAGRERAAPP